MPSFVRNAAFRSTTFLRFSTFLSPSFLPCVSDRSLRLNPVLVNRTFFVFNCNYCFLSGILPLVSESFFHLKTVSFFHSASRRFQRPPRNSILSSRFNRARAFFVFNCFIFCDSTLSLHFNRTALIFQCYDRKCISQILPLGSDLFF